MSFVPENEIKTVRGHSLAAFLSLLLILLLLIACLGMERLPLSSSPIRLVQITPERLPASRREPLETKIIPIAVSALGTYQWITEVHDYDMANPEAIVHELRKQYDKGLLPEDKSKTVILLKVDRQAPWEAVLKLMVAVQGEGFDLRPLYEATPPPPAQPGD